jgi:hypothetical protein
MLRYRIYTENVNTVNTFNAAKDYLGDFTVYRCDGCYNGKSEASVVYELITDSPNVDWRIADFCLWIRHNNNQECCLMTQEVVVARRL